MPRKIVSKDPITIQAVPEKVYDEVVMSQFKTSTFNGKTTARMIMLPTESATGEQIQEGAYVIDLKDFDKQMQQSPKLVRAWDDINDVMGLAYDFFILRDKVNEAIANGEDASALIAERNAALTALRAPVV